MSKMNLDKLIDQCPYNQKDISNYTGINKNTISKYVNNTFEKIDKGHLDLLCDFFKCTPNDLFELEPVQQKMFPPSEINNWMDINKTNAVGHRYNKTWETSQPDIQIRDNNGNIKSYEIKQSLSRKNRKFNGASEALKIMESLEKENSNNIYISEEDYDLEYMQERFEMEHKLSNNLFLITDYIIYNADISEFHDNLISDIEKYKSMTNSIEASKFMLVYRVLYIVIVQQLKNKLLLGFVMKIKNIYSISPFFSTIEDEKLEYLINESNKLLNMLSIKQKD